MPTVVHLDRAPGSEVQLFTASRGEPVGTIAIPVRDQVSAQLFISLMNTDWSFLGPGENVHWAVVQGSILTSQRNTLVQRMKGDWIMFIDADMVFDTGAIGRLVRAREQNDLDMLGGLCFQRVAPHQPTLYMRQFPDSGGYSFLEEWARDEIVEVDGTGLAFLVVHKRVFERIARRYDGPDFVWPSYEERLLRMPPEYFRWIDNVGEDLRFCQDAKLSGSKVWVDTGNPIGHISDQIVNEESFRQQLAMRTPEEEEARRRLNDKLGLPTVRREQAREALGW